MYSMDSDNSAGRLIVFAKYPRPGTVKTRLVPPLTYAEAADLYTAMLCDSLRIYHTLTGIEPLLYIADERDREPMRRLLWEQGVPHAERLPIYPQRGADLGKRLANAFAEQYAAGPGPVAVIGTDHPSLPLQYLADMFNALRDHDLVLGPADDGGYYALGLRAAQPELFRDMPWSTPDLLRSTLTQADQLGLRTRMLPEWYDVDDQRTLRRLMNDSADGNVGPMVAAALAQLDDILSGMEDVIEKKTATDTGEDAP